MKKTGLKILFPLFLCLCVLLLCGTAMAENEKYTASVADFNRLVPGTCKQIVLYDWNNKYYADEGGLLPFEPMDQIGVKIYPQTNCSVVSVICNGANRGSSFSTTLLLENIDGGVSTWFTMPEGDVLPWPSTEPSCMKRPLPRASATAPPFPPADSRGAEGPDRGV